MPIALFGVCSDALNPRSAAAELDHFATSLLPSTPRTIEATLNMADKSGPSGPLNAIAGVGIGVGCWQGCGEIRRSMGKTGPMTVKIREAQTPRITLLRRLGFQGDSPATRQARAGEQWLRQVPGRAGIASRGALHDSQRCDPGSRLSPSLPYVSVQYGGGPSNGAGSVFLPQSCCTRYVSAHYICPITSFHNRWLEVFAVTARFPIHSVD